jgi:DNA replication and repair protein RecF
LYLESLYLRNFRNYRDVSISFEKGTNLILGNNGEGKSNILEAIYMLATSKSFRNATDQQIVHWDTDNYCIRGSFVTEGGSCNIGLEYAGEKKSLSLNGAHEKRISNIIGYVYCVLHFFEDINLITGPPVFRRNYLDLVLSTADASYFTRLRRFLGVIRQKNRYLKDAPRVDPDLLLSWNDQLAESGSYIIHKRQSLLQFINAFIDEVLEERADLIFPFRLIYRSNIQDVNKPVQKEHIRRVFSEVLEKNLEREVKTEQSIYGPHRDDFIFADNKFEIRHFGSVGEARLASILLKLAQAGYYTKKRGVTPVLLIDDILLELDQGNMEKVLYLLDRGEQKIITTTERTKLPEIFSCDRLFHIREKGNISWKEIQKPI